MKVHCDYCVLNDAVVVITLGAGECFHACLEHIVPMILQVASTDNPVHSVEAWSEDGEAR